MSCWVLLALGTTLLPNPDSPSLADAAERKDLAGMRALLAKRSDVNQAQADGMTALLWSIQHENAESVARLLQAGADPNKANGFGVKPLSLACQTGNDGIVELLLQKCADPRTRLPGGETVLMTAARTGRLQPLKRLLEHGASVNETEPRGQNAIMWAAAEGHAEVVDALIKAGADFKASLPSGFNPLFFAVREGRSEVVRVLLKAGADVNQGIEPSRNGGGKAPSRGMTPLFLAVENGHFELAVELLKAGADPNDQRGGFTPLHAMTWVRKPNRGDGDDGDPAPIGSGNVSSLQLVESLIQHGADVNARLKRGASGRGVLSREGATPLLLAAMTADVPLIRALLKHGADPKIGNVTHSTPLMAAAGLGTLAPTEEAGTEPEAIEAVKLLLSLGADVNAVDDNGETAMHGAAYKSFPNVVRLLAQNGAKPSIWHQKDKYGWTPLSIAEGYRPGNFKPSPETLSALHEVLLTAGIRPPASSAPLETRKGYEK